MYVNSVTLFSQWTSRRLENWFQNSLKQLSFIQQKQVGLILGAAVADAAAHSWQGYTAEEIRLWQEQAGQNAAKAGVSSNQKHTRQSTQYSMSSMDPNPYLYGLQRSPAPVYVGERNRAYDTEPFPRLLAGSEEDPLSHGTNAEIAPLAFADLSSFPLTEASSSFPGAPGEHSVLNSSNQTGGFLENERLEDERDDEGEEEDIDNDDHDMENLLYLFHSSTYSLFAATVRSMGRSHGNFFSYVDEVKASWVEEVENMLAIKDKIKHVGRGGSEGQNWVTQEHGTLLHAVNTLLAIPVQYPYASDTTLHECTTPLLDFLLQIDDRVGGSSIAVKHACVLIILSVLIRCLQSNPDPLRNTALQIAMRSEQAPFLPFENLLASMSRKRRVTTAEPTQVQEESVRSTLRMVFPVDIQKTCFGVRDCEVREEHVNDSVNNEMQVVREAFTIASKYTSASAAAYPVAAFVKAVEEAIQMGVGCHKDKTFRQGEKEGHQSISERSSNVCHRAMLVGAFLGARFGVRAIPPRWLSATVDHQVLASVSVDVAQSSWNPDSG